MAKFLNTKGLSKWIIRLIEEADKEIVIVVPYIKTSKYLYSCIEKANKRGVEILIVYKEDSLNQKEYSKLVALENLNLMSHPNVHAKLYFNGFYLIIGSMNMYEYSEKNNREMGVLFHAEEIEEDDEIFYPEDPSKIAQDAKAEVRQIINGASIEKMSSKTRKKGLNFDILQSEEERVRNHCKLLNKHFVSKHFVPDESLVPVCKNYYDKVDVRFDYRIELHLKFDKARLESIFNKFKPTYNEFQFEGYKYYWNNTRQPIYLYTQMNGWDNELEDQIRYEKKGLDQLITHLKKFF